MASSSLVNMSVHDKGGNSLLVMPKLQFRWRVTFTNFGSSGVAKPLTRQAIEMSRPQMKFAEVPVHIYNTMAYLQGKPNWEPITLKLRDDSQSELSEEIALQLQCQLDYQDFSSGKAGIDYKFKTHIDVLDGNNGTAPEVLETWNLYGCYLQSANYDAINYATSDSMTVSLSIRFDNASQYSKDGGDNDLSSAGRVQRVDGNTA